jgi:hypothetical protein
VVKGPWYRRLIETNVRDGSKPTFATATYLKSRQPRSDPKTDQCFYRALAPGRRPHVPATTGPPLTTPRSRGSLKAGVLGGRGNITLALAWAALRAKLYDRRSQIGISRLAHYAGRRGIDPNQVDDRIINELMAETRDRSLGRNQAIIHRTTTQNLDRYRSSIARTRPTPSYRAGFSAETHARRLVADAGDVPAGGRRVRHLVRGGRHLCGKCQAETDGGEHSDGSAWVHPGFWSMMDDPSRMGRRVCGLAEGALAGPPEAVSILVTRM